MNTWLTVPELSSYLNLKPGTLYALAARAEIPHYRIGKIIRFKKDEIDAWIETKKARSRKERVEKIISSVYTSRRRPDHPRKEVAQ